MTSINFKELKETNKLDGLYSIVGNNTSTKKIDLLSAINALLPKFKVITLDDYNNLVEEDNVDSTTFYFIVDDDNFLFNKLKEIEDRISLLKTLDNFPIDNNLYGIMNQEPKLISTSTTSSSTGDTAS